MKRCLKKNLGRSTLSFEELRILLIEIEETLNNYPLTYIYDDMEGISQPLIPSDLIYGQKIISTHNGCHFEVTSTAKSLTKRAKNQFRILNQFTRQWRRDYLLGLREHYQCQNNKQKNTTPIKTGDVMVMKDDHTAQYW